MKKQLFFLMSFLILGLTGCEGISDDLNISIPVNERLESTIDEFSDELGQQISGAVSDITTQITEAAKDKAEEVVTEKATELGEDAKDRVMDKVEKIFDFNPGEWYENASQATYEADPFQMNAYWETEEEQGSLEITDGIIQGNVPQNAYVTVTFFHSLPTNIKVQNETSKENVALKVMDNPLTEKATYSFQVKDSQGAESTYALSGEMLKGEVFSFQIQVDIQ